MACSNLYNVKIFTSLCLCGRETNRSWVTFFQQTAATIPQRRLLCSEFHLRSEFLRSGEFLASQFVFLEKKLFLTGSNLGGGNCPLSLPTTTPLFAVEGKLGRQSLQRPKVR